MPGILCVDTELALTTEYLLSDNTGVEVKHDTVLHSVLKPTPEKI